MKLLTFVVKDTYRIGVLTEAGILDLPTETVKYLVSDYRNWWAT